MANSNKTLDRLINQLNTSATAKGDQPLWQVIVQLIKRLKELEALIASGTIGGGTPGAIGPAGATGPPFPAFIFLESEQSEDNSPIPGNTGLTGAIGPAGATGSQAIGFVLESELPEEPLMIPGPAGISGDGSAVWTLVENRVMTGNANEDFINLGIYNELLVIVRNVTKTVSGIIALRVSIDNGVTFLSASGDYFSVANTGIATAQVEIGIHVTSQTAARSGFAEINPFGLAGGEKLCRNTTTLSNIIISTTSALNAISVYCSAGVMNAGNIYVYGR